MTITIYGHLITFGRSANNGCWENTCKLFQATISHKCTGDARDGKAIVKWYTCEGHSFCFWLAQLGVRTPRISESLFKLPLRSVPFFVYWTPIRLKTWLARQIRYCKMTSLPCGRFHPGHPSSPVGKSIVFLMHFIRFALPNWDSKLQVLQSMELIKTTFFHVRILDVIKYHYLKSFEAVFPALAKYWHRHLMYVQRCQDQT